MTAAHVEPLARAAGNKLPRAPRKWQSKALLAVFVAYVVGVVWSWMYIDMTLLTLFGGFTELWNLVVDMVPPNFDNMRVVLKATVETIWMALIGTTACVVLSIPLAFMAARNTTPNPVVFAVARAIITLTRALPTLVLAAVLTLPLGIGPLPGLLALAIHSIGMVGKLFTEAVENTEAMSREAVTSTGAGKWQTVLATLVPQVTPSFIGTALYRLDINLRESAVLGFVGAGGVGFVVQQHLRSLDYQRAIAAVGVIFVVITLIEVVSTRLRASIIGDHLSSPTKKTPRTMARERRDHRLLVDAVTTRRLTPPWTYERLVRSSAGIIYLVLIVVAFATIDIPYLSALGLGDEVIDSFGRLFPPDFTTAGPELWQGIRETVAIGFIATTLGLVISVPLGILSARNIVVNRFVYGTTRLFMLALRGLPELIVAVLFVAAMGLGPVPGTLALTVGTATFVAKLIGDALEEVSPEPREAVFATGASRAQEFVTSVIPQALPNLVSQTLYMLDVNLRSSTVLGIIGGGGIGFLLLSALRVLQEPTVGAIVIVIFVIVYSIELIGTFVRWLVE
ncbi:MAG: phosphonate transporter, permease protein PhnE [Actinomycetota bacterium]|jgi:phosphonate transport system permease protein